MTDYVQKKIAPGVELLAVPAGRFKTNELAIHLAVPMEEQMAANYALAISAVSRKGKAYPDMRALHLHLDKLYGAAISVTANKSGGCQILKMGITTLDDRFALDDEKIAEAGLELLMNLLFEGRIGCFQPVTYLDRTGITQIRPLLYCREEESRRVARRLELPVVENPCPANGHSRRQEVKELIAGLELRYPDIKQKLFGSLQRYPLYGWNLHEEER